MTSQNSNSRRSINKISSYILSEQNIDIGNYTSGHLNESHLWKPPETKSHQQWETSKKHNQDLTNTEKFHLNSLNNNLNNTILKNLKDKKNNIEAYDVTINEIKSADSFHKSFYKDTISNSGPNFILPCLKKSETVLNFPISDKEMAIHFLSSPFKGASKKEKFNNFKQFESAVLQKQDLLANTILHGKSNCYFFYK